ncbi:MAG TPA: FG-GAP-like repeat-containing protein [Polyangiaceae bacterium]|nr:FG-GAP-like repeat-containing protein [Polyangiaceae bacterium]
MVRIVRARTAWCIVLVTSLFAGASGCILGNFEIEGALGGGGIAGGGSAGASFAGMGSAGIGGSAGGVSRISPPTLVADRYVMLQGTTLVRDAAAGLLANDTPVNLSVTGFTNVDPSRPRLFDADMTLERDGSFRFTPKPRFFGTYKLSYTAENQVGIRATSDIEIRVVPSEIDLDAIVVGIGGYVLYGAKSEALGAVLDGAGDVNGDEVSDLLIGAPNANSGDGAAYVVFGKTDLDSVDVEPVSLGSKEKRFLCVLGAPAEKLGSSVAGLGDVDGDELGDLAIGASGENGRVYVTQARDLSVVNRLPLAHGYSIAGDSANVAVGRLLEAGGDLDGDGVPDALVSALNGSTGWLHLPFGDPELTGQLGVTGLPGAHVRGAVEGDAFPLDAAFVGDLDGDGGDEVLAASNTAFYLFSGNGGFPVDAGAATVGGTRGNYRAARVAEGSASVTGLGDVNGDSAKDFAYCDGTAACTVVFAPIATLAQGTPVYGFTRDAQRLSVRGGGDVDGDGLSDILFSDDQSAYVVYGNRAGLLPTDVSKLGQNGFSIIPASGGTITAASIVGDVNGDGIDDLAIADAAADDGNGRVYVVFGLSSR